MAAKKKTEDTTVETFEAMEFHQDEVTFHLVGSTPFICNRMSEKAARQLLLPSGKKTTAEKATSLKHNPLEEFRASPYTNRDPKSPTLIQMVSSAFRNAMASAALEIPGMKKAQVKRLTWVNQDRVDIYGVPQLLMSITRSADMAKTPDVRTRAIIPDWAAAVTIRFARPQLTGKGMANLMTAAGLLIGVGDWRNEKGAGSYGQFEIVAPDDPRYVHAKKHGARKAQEAAMLNPLCYDDETDSLLSWYKDEVDRRGQATAPKAGRNGRADARPTA